MTEKDKDGKGPGKGTGQRGKGRGIYKGKRPVAAPANIIPIEDGKAPLDAEARVRKLTEDALIKLLGNNKAPLPGNEKKVNNTPEARKPPAVTKPKADEEVPTKVDRLSDTVLNLLENNETPPEKYLSIVSSTHIGLDLFFAALSRTMARSAQHLNKFCEKAEEELFDTESEDWEKMEKWEKFRYYQEANGAYQAKMKFIAQVAQKVNWDRLETEVKQLVATVQSGHVIDPKKQEIAKQLLEAIISGNQDDLMTLGVSIHPDSIDRNMIPPDSFLPPIPPGPFDDIDDDDEGDDDA